MSSFDETYNGDENHAGYFGYNAEDREIEQEIEQEIERERDLERDNVPPSYGFSSSPTNAAEYSHSHKPFEQNGEADEGLFTGDGPLLPEPGEMKEEGSAFREWRRLNAIHLEEKEAKEKELRTQILNEAEEFKNAFYEKRNLNCEATKDLNREREKLYLTNQEKFHKEADKQYWKAVSEIIPREVANIEKRRKKKDEERKPGITIVQGPKPGKPTDMTRMRQLVAKLKQKSPSHMLPKEVKDAKNSTDDKDIESKKDDKHATKKDAKKKDEKETKDGTEKNNVSPAEKLPENGKLTASASEDPAAIQEKKVDESETKTVVP